MKKRILTGWTFRRGLYAAMGTFIIIQAVIMHEWIGILLGGYFAAMGIFAFGCAGGNCFGGTCYTEVRKNNSGMAELNCEEVKQN
ncbi:MAG: hypothetical protein C5B59_02205 [Bacteroidetes bacterium]|nr:MAG: hypothetical protein C5B59_02205 [Bacteroidota bacterium]